MISETCVVLLRQLRSYKHVSYSTLSWRISLFCELHDQFREEGACYKEALYSIDGEKRDAKASTESESDSWNGEQTKSKAGSWSGTGGDS